MNNTQNEPQVGYKLITRALRDQFEELVAEHLNDGWSLVGGAMPIISPHHNWIVFTQTLIHDQFLRDTIDFNQELQQRAATLTEALLRIQDYLQEGGTEISAVMQLIDEAVDRAYPSFNEELNNLPIEETDHE